MVGFLGGAAPDAGVASDLKGAGGLGAPALAASLAIAAAFLSSADAAHLASAMEELAAAHSLKPKACRGAVRSLVLALGGAVKYGLSGEALGADMRALGACSCSRLWPAPFPGLSLSLSLSLLHTSRVNPSILFLSPGVEEARAAQVAGFFESQRGALAQLAVDRAVEASALMDAEWRFGVTVSTDDVGRVGSSFVQLRLMTSGAPGEAAQAHAIEMTVPGFYSLLASLEKAQGYTNLLGATN